MSLFQPSVLKKYLSQQDTASVQKAYKKYTKYFHNTSIQENIRNSKEEQFQEGFLRELFVEILGYTLNPAPKFNLTTELKNIKGSKKVDGAILKDGNALGVIELKGTNTKDLESIRQQAFDYKANQTGCIYVITSNFEKLRFYINNAVDYEEFNLFALTEKEFEIFYLCLAKDNLLANKPLAIKEASIVEEENITKHFYADYSLFKRELYRDLVKQNRNNVMLMELSEKTSKLTLFKKSQKLIDRFLFILFAEDRGLLAPNSISTILKEWKALEELDMVVPLYDRYKQYFGYLDNGRKGTDKKEEIFAYNGGLFQPDTILDAVIIDDDLLYRHTKKLSTYDFESQVDVNILGHIFEHSLNEIESVNAEIEGTTFDKQKTKRKKDGVFYTPKYITKYIVDNTIGKLCTEKKQKLGIVDEEYAKGRKNRQATTIIKLEQQLKDYREWLLQLTICDPACGSGAFLNQALDFLIKEHGYIDELNKQLFGGGFAFPDIENQILEHNIYGVDLNEESIEIAKLSLWLRTAQPKRKLTSLNNNIKCGNSLIDSKAIAGDKAFNWKEQFPEVFANGGFDVIVGNPPYVNIVNISNVAEREFYQNKYATVKNKSDLYSIFVEKSYHILKRKGILSFIFPNSWLGTESFSKFREFLVEKTIIHELIKLPNDVFADATVTPVIVSFIKEVSSNNLITLKEYSNNTFNDTGNKLSYERIKNTNTFTFSFEAELIINVETIDLGQIAEFSLGIKTSDDKRFIFNEKINDECRPILRGRNISRYYHSKPKEWIWYAPELITQKAGGRPRILENFLGKKIYIQDIAQRINACYCEEPILSNDTLNLIYKMNQNYDLKAILVLLNSKFVNKWFESEFQMGLHIKINQLQQIPIPKNLYTKQSVFIEIADLMFSLNKEIQEVSQKFQRTLQRKFDFEDLPKKLQDWYLLSYSEFIKELAKKKIKLSLSEEAEWEDYFNQESKKALDLKSQIDTTDKEIDQMVYELYGLSEEEIKIIEQS